MDNKIWPWHCHACVKFRKIKPSLLSLAVCTALFINPLNAAEEPVTIVNNDVEFDPAFLNVTQTMRVDLSHFENGASALPGKYRVEIYVNKNPISTEMVEIKMRKDKSTYSCFSKKTLNEINLNFERLSSDAHDALLKNSEECVDIAEVIPEAKIDFDSSEQRVDLSIPQIYITTQARGSVNPALWDSGIPALMLGYSITGYNDESYGNSNNSLFAGLNAGLNVGAWYFRHNGNYNWSQDGIKKYTTLNTYAQRDLPSLKSQMIVGQSNTLGRLFDTIPFTGVQVASNEQMLPQSQRGYAPEIHGIAQSNARVTVSQNGQTIYETTVPPGEFVINDIYPSGYGGDLVVKVREADGSERSFSMPYSSVTQLLRPGAAKYSATVGKVRGDNLRSHPMLYQGTFQYGLSNNLTAYTGFQLSPDYQAGQLGLVVDTAAGAVSFDLTQAYTTLGSNKSEGVSGSENKLQGQSYKLSFSKIVTATDSNLSLAAYRFSTKGYMDLMTAMQTRDAIADGLDISRIWRAKNRITMTASQGLPGAWGQFYLSSSLQNYWGRTGNDKQFQVGYNNHYKAVSYSLSANKTYSNYGRAQTNYLLSFSVPLGNSGKRNLPQLRMDLNHDSEGRTSELANISGSAGETNQFNYGITASNSNQSVGTSLAANSSYQASSTSLNAAYSEGKHYRSLTAGINGMAIVHQGGVTLSPYSPNTAALVEAKGAEGAHVSGYPGVTIDRNGYAIVPYLNPYEMNEISIDPAGTSHRVELENTSQRVAPNSGAIVKLAYGTRSGIPLLINAPYHGHAVPFGATVMDGEGNNLGAVGQGGQIFARVSHLSGSLRVSWGGEGHCNINYNLPASFRDKKSIQIIKSECL